MKPLSPSQIDTFAALVGSVGSPGFFIARGAIEQAVAAVTANARDEMAKLEATIDGQLKRLTILTEYYDEEGSTSAILKLARLEADAERFRAISDNNWLIYEVANEAIVDDTSGKRPARRRVMQFAGFTTSALPGATFDSVEEAVDASMAALAAYKAKTAA